MIARPQPETMRQIVIVAALVITNAVVSNFIWWLLGSLRSRVRTLARTAAAFAAILNLGLGMMCLLRMLRHGPDWFYVALLVVAFIFAYRVGGATRGQYN